MLRWYYCKKKEDLALKSVMPVNAKRSKDDTETETVQKKRPPQTLLDNWLKRPSLSPDCLGALEPGASSVPEQSVPGSGTETVPLPLAHSSDASPRVSSPEPPHVLAGMIFAFAGVVESPINILSSVLVAYGHKNTQLLVVTIWWLSLMLLLLLSNGVLYVAKSILISYVIYLFTVFYFTKRVIRAN